MRWVVSSEQDSKLMVQSFVAFEEMKLSHGIARYALRVLHKMASERKINVRLKGTSVPFDSSSQGKEQQERGRLFQNMPRANSNGDPSSASEHTQDAVTIGLVWLQDMTPASSREQMGPMSI